jgi:hypothetical protein
MKIAHGFNRGFNGQNEMSPGGTAENRVGNIWLDFFRPCGAWFVFGTQTRS